MTRNSGHARSNHPRVEHVGIEHQVVADRHQLLDGQDGAELEEQGHRCRHGPTRAEHELRVT